ncbi:MAG: FAD:protein FMN transferase [Chitinophagaceae bacterium]|nr:FAD:protein FMN transferase [Chitinophagaceae bacterium]
MHKIAILSFALFLLINCNRVQHNTVLISGEAQGTTYHITYLTKTKISYKEQVDSIFNVIDLSMSTYIPSSIISRINQNDSNVFVDQHFMNVFNKSREVSVKTNGLFDITVGPVINAWGFGFSKKEKVDSSMIDSLLMNIGYHLVQITNNKLEKEKPGVMLDFNAIAQGYTVDVLAAYLEEKNIQDYLIELGGEVKAKGKKPNNKYWTVGIDQPNEKEMEGRPLKAVIQLNDQALATSGNYRKYYIENGQKFSHIIDPHTGYPAKNNLLSATVIAPDCMTADAYATAFMLMGLEKSRQFLKQHPDLQLEVFFIYDEDGKWKTYTSEKLVEWVKEVS